MRRGGFGGIGLLENNAGQLNGAVISTTARLKLRRFLPSDLSPFAALNADPEVMRYLGGAALTRAQSDAILFGADRSFVESGYGKIAVERIEDGAFLGTCGLSVESWYPDDMEIGWRLARAYWGFGHAGEAAAAWMPYAFEVLKAPRVISISDAPNLRSIAVMKKIGLRFDHEAKLSEGGESFDAVIYSSSFADWQTRQAG